MTVLSRMVTQKKLQKYEPVADDSISPNVKDVDGSTMPMDYDKSRSWYVFSGEEVGKSLQDYLDELENEDNWNDEDDWEEPEGYTEKELDEIKSFAEFIKTKRK